MRLLKTGIYSEPFDIKWNECLFVDIWDNYHLYTDCGCTTFDYRLNRYLEDKKHTINYFNQNNIRIIMAGKR